jgi:hypothetical protein
MLLYINNLGFCYILLKLNINLMKMKFEQPDVDKEMSTKEEDLLFTEEKRFGKISSSFELSKTMSGKAREFINAVTLATMLSTMGAGLAKAETLAPESGDGNNKTDKNKTEVLADEALTDSQGRIWTPEMLQGEIDKFEEWANQRRERAEEQGKPMQSEEMHELNKKHDALRTLDRDDEAEATLAEMFEMARKSGDIMDIENPRWDMMKRIEKSYTYEDGREYTWYDSAPMEEQSSEWQELNQLFMEEINMPIPEGDLSAEQKDALTEHAIKLNELRFNLGQSIDIEAIDAIYNKLRDIALRTERVEAQIMARKHMDSYELSHAKDHHGGALPNEKHSPEWQKINVDLREKLDSVDGAYRMWAKGFTHPTPELLELLHENGVE